MCGILGSPSFTPQVRALLPWLAVSMQSRGIDSWGAADGFETVHHIGKITSTWKEEVGKFELWDQGIFHTRAASQGSAKVLANAHPFTEVTPDGVVVTGIHNGHISNHNVLNGKFNRHCDVDSQHIWKHRAEGRTWEDLIGWANLAWWETEPNGAARLHLSRFNSEALHVAKLEDGGWVFASAVDAIDFPCEMLGFGTPTHYPIEEKTHYYFGDTETGDLVLFKAEKMAWGVAPPVVQTAPASSYVYTGHGSHYPQYGETSFDAGSRSFRKGYCLVCDNPVGLGLACCKRCWDEHLKDFELSQAV